jgi:hypothetical protein
VTDDAIGKRRNATRGVLDQSIEVWIGRTPAWSVRTTSAEPRTTWPLARSTAIRTWSKASP